jgi:hypothetical protein
MEVAHSACQAQQGTAGARGSMLPGRGCGLAPCEAVHTFWMQFPIDLVYLDRKKAHQEAGERCARVAALGLPLGAFGPRASGGHDPRDADCAWGHSGVFRGFRAACSPSDCCPQLYGFSTLKHFQDRHKVKPHLQSELSLRKFTLNALGDSTVILKCSRALYTMHVCLARFVYICLHREAICHWPRIE